MKILEFFKNLFFKKEQQPDIQPNIEVNKLSDKDKFEKAMKFIRVVEGGKFNHPNDPGGFTNMGLTQRDYPKLNLHKLTRQQADDIFYKDYWKKSIAGKLPDPVFISYFDSVVNTGVTRANKILQEVVGVKVDGIAGSQTLKAVEGYGNPNKLALAIADRKQKFYQNLTTKNSKFKSFIRGWTRRTNALKNYITSGDVAW
jgi:lysozyme family protein